MPGPSADGAGGGAWGGWDTINTRIDINMDIDIHVIINLNIDNYTKRLHNRVHTSEISQSGVKSPFASIPKSIKSIDPRQGFGNG